MSQKLPARIHSTYVYASIPSTFSASTRCCPVLAPIGLQSSSPFIPCIDALASLQTGMRGAWGKPYGTVARVNIGQIIMSIRCKESNSAVIIEALRRARYKFPGRQKIIVSKKWGFTNVSKGEYQKLKEEKKVLQYVTLFKIAQLVRSHCIGMVLMCNSFDPRVLLNRTCATSFVPNLNGVYHVLYIRCPGNTRIYLALRL
jgi:hypothetical protein